jgi:hypothetical protein
VFPHDFAETAASGMTPPATGKEAVMRARLRAEPAWATVLAFGVAATLIRLAFGPPEESVVATVLLVASLLALAAALIARGHGNGWGVYGVMLVANYGLQAVDWSLGVEAFVYVVVTTSVVWLLFDRRADDPMSRGAADGSWPVDRV